MSANGMVVLRGRPLQEAVTSDLERECTRLLDRIGLVDWRVIDAIFAELARRDRLPDVAITTLTQTEGT